MKTKPYVVGISGASGVIYGLRLVRVLAEMEYPIILTITDAARLVIEEEVDIPLGDLHRPDLLEKIFHPSVVHSRLGPRASPGAQPQQASGFLPSPKHFPAEGIRSPRKGYSPATASMAGEWPSDARALDAIRYCHYRDLLAPIASGSFPTAGMVVIPCSMSTVAQIANGASQNLLERAADVAIKEKRKLVLVPRETPFSAIHLENMLKLSRLGVDILPANPGFYGSPKTIDELIDFVVGKVLDILGIESSLFRRWMGRESMLSQQAESL